MNVARLRTYAGLAAAIVPCAMIVHLIAEAAAVGRDGLGLNFALRHAYFGAIFAAAALWFGVTVGIGRSRSERRRRGALLCADFRGRSGLSRLATLGAVNLGFFALTQAIEGVPISTGALGLSLGVALAGSLAAAALVVFFGGSIVAVAVESIIGTCPERCCTQPIFRRPRVVLRSRHATAAYTLARPNRPPPISFSF